MQLSLDGVSEASAVVRSDGVLLASTLSFNPMVNEIFAMLSATILSAATNMTTQCKLGPTDRISIYTSEGKIKIRGAGRKAMLICFTSLNPEPENMEEGMIKAAEKLSSLI